MKPENFNRREMCLKYPIPFVFNLFNARRIFYFNIIELSLENHMSDLNKKSVCSNFDNPLNEEDDFCPNCGALFTEGIKCINHKNVDADGVCIICCEPFCKDCGLSVNDLYFVCDAHSEYEIIEGMARVFGSFDDTEAQYIKSILEQDGLHPILFNRNQPGKSARSINTIVGTRSDFLTQTENETKIMVPCQEIILAETMLDELNL